MSDSSDTISFSKVSSNSLGISTFNERSNPLVLIVFFKQSEEQQIYAPLPFFFPVVSTIISSSGVRRIRINSFLGFDSPHPVHTLNGIFLAIHNHILNIPLSEIHS